MFSINSKLIIGSTLSLLVFFSSPAALATDAERNVTLQEDVTQAELIKLNVPAGDVEIAGTTGTNVTAVVTATCQKENQDNCYQVLKDLGWSMKMGSIAEFGLSPAGITRYDHVTIKVKLSVPKDIPLEVNLSAGELRIVGTSACVTAEVNAGDIKINVKENQLSSAELTAKVGDVKLITASGAALQGDRSLLVGASLTWNKGTGACHTKASVLAGEAQVILNK